MRIAMTLVLGVLMLLLEAIGVEIFDVELWFPHVAVALAVYLALEKTFLEGAAEVLLLAWVAELLSGSPPGILSLALTVVFLLTRVANLRLSLRSRVLRLILVMLAAALAQSLQVLVLVVLGQPTHLLAALLYGGLPSALSAPLGFVVVQFVLGRVDDWLQPRNEGLLRP